jgi:RNA polymerase-binding protein DksA
MKGGMHMSKPKKEKSEWDILRDLLLTKHEELTKRIEQRRMEIAMDQEPYDEGGLALRNSSAGMAIANMERDARTLAEIDRALRRMENGEYGTCAVCNEKIPLPRLQAIPWTRRCIDCAGGSIANRSSSTGEGFFDFNPPFRFSPCMNFVNHYGHWF